MVGLVSSISVRLACCHGPSTTWAGAHTTCAGKNLPTPVGMTENNHASVGKGAGLVVAADGFHDEADERVGGGVC